MAGRSTGWETITHCVAARVCVVAAARAAAACADALALSLLPGTDFEGGVAAAAFVTGGALPSSLFGKASSSPIHLVDLHFSICLMAGLSDEECRDDDTPGIPPVDGVDLRGAFATLNITRPVAQGAGPSAGT